MASLAEHFIAWAASTILAGQDNCRRPLKTAAWNDRKHTHPGRDASVLLLFARSYMDCDNFDRLKSDHDGDLLDSGDFDYVEAGARLVATLNRCGS